MPRKNLNLVLCSALIAPLLASCAVSYGDIRAKAPFETRTFTAEATALSDCALNNFTQKYSRYSLTEDSYSFTRIKDGPTIHLAAQVTVISNQYMWDAAFVPLSDNQTRVELRPYGLSLWGTPSYPKNVWELLEACGSKSR